MKEKIDDVRKLALYQYFGSNDCTWYSVMEVHYSTRDKHHQALPDGEVREIPVENYARVSDVIEIKFSPLSDDACIQQAVAALDEAERKAIANLNAALMSIRDRKSRLLALSHQPESV